MNKPWSKRKPAKPSYPFFGLTQVCQQVRAEYRPLWLSASVIVIEFERFEKFVQTFFPESQQLDSEDPGAVGLKCLVLTWDPVQRNQFLPILQFSGRYPATNIQLSLRILGLPPIIKDKKCPYCGHRGNGIRTPLCEHKANVLADWEEHRLNALRSLLVLVEKVMTHDNEFWKSDISAGFIERVDLPLWLDLDTNGENERDLPSIELSFSRENSSSWMPIGRFRGHETCASQPADCKIWKEYLEGVRLEDLDDPEFPIELHLAM
jgi:hypothetical protein